MIDKKYNWLIYENKKNILIKVFNLKKEFFLILISML